MAKNQKTGAAKSYNISDTKLAALLLPLSPADRQRLLAFVQNAWSDTPRRAVRLLDWLLEESGHRMHTPKREVAARLFPAATAAHSHKLLDRALHELTDALHRFLMHEELAHHPALGRQLLMQAASRRQLPSLMETSKKWFEKATPHSLAEQPEVHAWHWYEYAWRMDAYLHSEEDKIKQPAEALPDMARCLERHYLVGRLFLACEALNRQYLISDAVPQPLPDEALLLASQPFAEDATVQIYLCVIDLLKDLGRPEKYDQAVDLYQRLLPRLGLVERRSAASFMVNHAYRLYRRGHVEFINKIVSLYSFLLQHDVLSLYGHISASTFLNMANIIVMAGEFDRADDFIKKEIRQVRSPDRQVTGEVAQAFLYFHKGEFDLSANLAAKLDGRALRHDLVVRPILLRSLYEELQTKSDDQKLKSLYAQAAAFRQFLRRHTSLSDANKEMYSAFTILLQKMAAMVSAKKYLTPGRKARWQARLTASPPPFAKDWLERKLAALPERQEGRRR